MSNTASPAWRRNLAGLAALGPLDWRYLGLSLVLLPWVSRGLRRGGLAAFSPLLSSRDAVPHPSPLQLAVARRVARMVNLAAARGPWQTSCLTRSLLLARFLAARDIPFELVMAGRLEDGADDRFSAHAWVRCGDAILNDAETNTALYQPFEGRQP